MSISVIGGGKPFNNSSAIITTSGSWVVPAGVFRIRARLVGAGATASGAYKAGNAATGEIELNVTPGESITIAIGATAAGSSGGNTSIIGTFGTVTAAGGVFISGSTNAPDNTGWLSYGMAGVAGAVRFDY